MVELVDKWLLMLHSAADQQATQVVLHRLTQSSSCLLTACISSLTQENNPLLSAAASHYV